jgi:hypothetical protein
MSSVTRNSLIVPHIRTKHTILHINTIKNSAEFPNQHITFHHCNCRNELMYVKKRVTSLLNSNVNYKLEAAIFIIRTNLYRVSSRSAGKQSEKRIRYITKPVECLSHSGLAMYQLCVHIHSAHYMMHFELTREWSDPTCRNLP